MGRGEEQLLEGAKHQDVALVQKLLSRGKGKLLSSSKKVNVNFQDTEGFSALHQVALLGNADLTFLLIDCNASVDIRDKKGLSPLHYAAWKGKAEVVAALLESGASGNASARNGCTPLHLAAQYGHCNACKILLQYGADVQSRQSDGCSPLDLACEFGRDEVVRFLLQHSEAVFFSDQLLKLDPNAGSAPITSPLHLAARNGHTSIVRLLLQGGADINWRSGSGTCLHEAVANQKPEIAQLLIDCGIDLTLRSGLGQTALELANQLPRSPDTLELIRKLTEAQPWFLQVFAVNDFQNILDRSSLAFTKGTLITVLEQNPNGNWKGKIEGAHGEPPLVGYFPSSYVQVCRPSGNLGMKAVSVDSGIHQHDEEPLPMQSLYGPRTSNFSKHPPHHYINLDPRSKQSPQKVLHPPPKVAPPNVANPSYEDVICSQHREPRSVVPHGSSNNAAISQHAPLVVSSQRSSEAVITGGRPSISNPGYEDILVDNSAPSNNQSPPRSFNAQGSYKPRSLKHPHQGSMQRRQQEISVEKLSHQKKLLMSGSDMQQATKRDSHPHIASKKPPPLTRPKPTPVAKKPLHHTKPPPPTSPLQETSGVSAELQKALSRRQRVIDDAAAGEANNVPPPHPSPSKLRDSPPRQVRPLSGSRRPPPEPPRRISSMCSETSPLPTGSESGAHGSPAMIEEKRDHAKFSFDNHRVSNSPENRELPLHVAETPRTVPHQWGSKPTVAVKPKPAVMKKPGLKKLSSTGEVPANPTLPAVPSPQSSKAKRFDLSALDGVGTVQTVVSSPSPAPMRGDPPNLNPCDDFDWPAPPPLNDNTSDKVFASSNPLAARAGSAGPPSDPRNPRPSTGVLKNCEVVSPSIPSKPAKLALKTSPSLEAPLPPPPDDVIMKPLLTPSNQLHPSPVDVLPPHSSFVDNEVRPPPVPAKKLATSSEFPPKADAPPLNLDSCEDPAETRRMLDDITSMFDGLAQEFDDILS